jgi:hypothetical protein
MLSTAGWLVSEHSFQGAVCRMHHLLRGQIYEFGKQPKDYPALQAHRVTI